MNLSRGKVVKTMIAVSGIATLAVFAALPTITSPVVAVAVLCGASFLLMWGSLYWSLPSLLASPGRVGLLGACMNCAGSVGGISIPLITGFILQRTGSFDAVLHFTARARWCISSVRSQSICAARVNNRQRTIQT